MKKLFLLSLWFVVGVAQASSKIVCAVNGSDQKLILENRTGVDLRWPGSYGKVPLHVNGSSTPSEFTFLTEPTILGEVLKFVFRHPIWINDIALWHRSESDSTSFLGAWIQDYPPALNLTCEFAD